LEQPAFASLAEHFSCELLKVISIRLSTIPLIVRLMQKIEKVVKSVDLKNVAQWE